MKLNELINKLSGIAFFGMMYKEFLGVLRKKKIPILIIALPMVLSVIYGAGISVINQPFTSGINVGVCNFDNSTEVNNMLDELNSELPLTVLFEENCVDNLKQGVKDKAFLLGFIISEGFSNRLKAGNQSALVFLVDNSQPSMSVIMSTVLRHALHDYNSQFISSAEQELKRRASEFHENLLTIKTVVNSTISMSEENKLLLGPVYEWINPVFNDLNNRISEYEENVIFIENLDVDYLIEPVTLEERGVYEGINMNSFIFPIMFCIISLFSSLLLASTNIIYDKKTKYLLKIKSSNTSFISYLFSKVCFFASIALIQFAFIFLIVLAFGGSFSFDFSSLMGAFLLITGVNALIGVLIGVLTQNENIAILVSLIITLPILFLSGAMVPIDIFPPFLKIFAEIIPLQKEILLLNQVALLSMPLTHSAIAWVLLYYFTGLFAANYIILKKRSLMS